MEAEPETSAAAAAAVTTEEVSVAPNPAQAEVILAEGSEEGKREEGEDDEEAVVARAQRLIDKILETQDNPNPRHLHALATILEAQEAKYLQESTSPPCNNARASHTIGRLGNLVRDNDEFYESISSSFLSESRYSVSIRAASARLLLSSASSWMYPHVFDDVVLDNIKTWVTEDGVVSDNECIWKHELGANKPTDTDLLRTYATGLLALSMTAGGEVVEDILTSGLSAKLMRYLRIRVLGDTSNQGITFPAETRHSSLKSRDENRARTRQLSDAATRLEGSRVGDEGSVENPSVSLDCDRNVVSMQSHGDVYWCGGDSIKSELTNLSSEAVDLDETVDEDADVSGDGWQNRNLLDARSKHGERLVAAKSTRDEDVDENMRDELSRRRANRGLPRSRLKVRINETVESERTLTSPSVCRLGSNIRGPRDKTEESKLTVDMKTNSSRSDFDSLFNVEDKDERLSDCIIGSSDISEMVRKAIKAAEAEARTAGAPVEALKAAGDAAAELVKSAAMEAFKNTNDQEAVVLAASKAASTVIDAAIATEISRCANKADEDLVQLNSNEAKPVEEMEDFIILDTEHVASLREKYCIQCLEILGEYVEALGPILHEKGVDVCLALLQGSIKDERGPDNMALLPEVLKLICALAAHRKFAALFVDRGGMQKLLSVRRVAQTFFGLSSCLFTIGSLQGIMERVCALPSDVVNQIVELALQLLECSQDQARKNAAIFFAAAFVFRAVLDSFDAQEGLQKMLNLLHGAASVRSGGNSGSLTAPNTTLRNDRSAPEVLTASEKQIAYHTCVALRQYFRAHLLLLVDSLRPNKSSRSVARNAPSARQAYKPLDISNEAMDAAFLQIQRDRKIGPAFVRARWPSVDKFLASNGHITMLELCQAPPVERYLHDLAQYALGVLHLITFLPYSRKLIVNATLSNNRVGMAVILDAANGAGFVGPEVIHPALNLLVNLVCPPPSISNKPSPGIHGVQSVSAQTLGASSDNRERHSERIISGVPSSIQNESQAHSVERGGATAVSAATSSNPQTPTPMSAGVVGDRRISLGPGAGCAGLAAQLEQGYRQAREAVRANNGIKVILHLLHPRMITPPAALDCIRALACRVLLGLARDDAIAQILTKLQVGKKLSELIRDSGSQASGTEQGRWQSELAQVAIELIAIVTNSGRASTFAATDAAAPTLRRIERAAIAAATPISYHSRELLQLIHEHLQASGFTATAALLQKEADFTPLPSSGGPPLTLHQTPVHETSSVQLQWPSGRASAGFCSNLTKTAGRECDTGGKSDFTPRKKLQAFSSSFSHGKCQLSRSASTIKQSSCVKSPTAQGMETVSPVCKSTSEMKTPLLLPIKRKFTELKEASSASTAKRLATVEMTIQTPVSQVPIFGRRNFLATDPAGLSPIINSSSREAYSRTPFSNMPGNNSDDVNNHSTPGLLTTSVSHSAGMPADQQPGNNERMTLDSLVVQYLKHQHRQCPAPITTLPPLSLLHPHVCPEPSHGLNAPANVTARIGTREFRKQYGGIHAHRRDRQFIYSRFRPCRPCRDDTLLSCITFLGDSSRIVTGSHSGDLKIFDTNNGNILESQLSHQTPVTMVKSAFSGVNQLILSSGSYDVKLWDASSISGGPLHSFDVCKAAHFSHSGANFAALSSDIARREVLLYDIETCKVELCLSDSSNGSGTVRGHTPLLIHFNPSDKMILWNGILWDRRSANAVHRFDQFTDYGGGGFHPSGNEVIINSEVWDLRKFKLLRTVPSLDQTVITFNGTGDIIYAILRRNIEDITSAVHTRRVRHPLFPAFRTIDAVNYSDIATVQVDRCILDLARDPTDSLIGVISMDDHEDMSSSARLYEVGRKRPTDDDSDPDDGGESDEEDDENDESEADVDPILGADLDGDGDSDSDDMSNDEDDEDVDSADELDEDGDFNLDDVDFEGGQGFLDIIGGPDQGDEEDSDIMVSFSSEDEGGFTGNGFAF